MALPGNDILTHSRSLKRPPRHPAGRPAETVRMHSRAKLSQITAIEGLREISSILKGGGIDDPCREAEIMLAAIGIGKVALYRDNPVLSEMQLMELQKFAERRRRREPLQYIIGHVDFCGLKIKVGPGVLIPRPETELLAEEAIKTLTSNKLRVTSEDKSPHPPFIKGGQGGIRNASCATHHPLRILDLCTGSGCLALAAARALEGCEVIGIDLSGIALEYAKENARLNGINNVAFIKGDLFEPVRGERFDVVVSNPPYIKSGDIKGLSSEIRCWEPMEAIDGGADGLLFYRKVISQAVDYLLDGGSLIVELGHGEAEEVIRMAEGTGLRFASLTTDYNGIERILHLTM